MNYIMTYISSNVLNYYMNTHSTLISPDSLYGIPDQ